MAANNCKDPSAPSTSECACNNHTARCNPHTTKQTYRSFLKPCSMHKYNTWLYRGNHTKQQPRGSPLQKDAAIFYPLNTAQKSFLLLKTKKLFLLMPRQTTELWFYSIFKISLFFVFTHSLLHADTILHEFSTIMLYFSANFKTQPFK